MCTTTGTHEDMASRPWYKGVGGGQSEKNFSALQASVWSKNKRGRGGGSTGAASVYELSVVDAILSPRLNTFSFHGVRRNRHTMIHCTLRSFSICTCQQVACSRLRDSRVPYPLPLSTAATQAKKVRTRKQETAPPTFSCLSLSRQMKACISYLHLRQRNI